MAEKRERGIPPEIARQIKVLNNIAEMAAQHNSGLPEQTLVLISRYTTLYAGRAHTTHTEGTPSVTVNSVAEVAKDVTLEDMLDLTRSNGLALVCDLQVARRMRAGGCIFNTEGTHRYSCLNPIQNGSSLTVFSPFALGSPRR